MFETSKMIFSKVAAIQSVDMEMPNIHYFVADLKKINVPNTGEVGAGTIIIDFAIPFFLYFPVTVAIRCTSRENCCHI